MRLTQRLLFGSLLLIATFLLLVVISFDQRLGRRLKDDANAENLRDARLIATQWLPGRNADSLADIAGAVLNGIPMQNYAQRYGSYYYSLNEQTAP